MSLRNKKKQERLAKAREAGQAAMASNAMIHQMTLEADAELVKPKENKILVNWLPRMVPSKVHCVLCRKRIPPGRFGRACEECLQKRKEENNAAAKLSTETDVIERDSLATGSCDGSVNAEEQAPG